MYSGSTEFNNLIEKSGGNALITRFTFSDFSIKKFTKLEYYGGSNNSDDIAIGTTNMAYLDVNAITDKLITNQEFLFEVGMELSDGTVKYAPMGYFTVQKPDSDEDTVNFKAYDRMQKFEKPYVSSLAYPTDSEKVLDELCTICGVELATPIASPITITDKLDGYTCREVLGYIAGIHGLFACFDRYGKLNLRWYSTTPVEKQIGLIWSLTKSQSNYKVEKITIAKDTETTYTSGTGICGINHSNPYATQEIADSIYASLSNFTYRPCEISMLDDIRLDPWDMLKVTYLDGSVLIIPVMSLEHSFTSGETRVKSVGKTDTENEYGYAGPVTQAMDRMATELLVANRIIATKVDAEWVNAHTVTADKLEATNARVSTLEANSLTAETADLRYANITLANIDTANIDVANIGLLFTKVGLIDRATIVDGHITGFLDAVEINANNITAGTLIADRILLKGSESGLLYALNNLGELTSTEVDTLDGTILTQRTVTADKLIANSITANELDVTNIFGNSAVLSTLTSQQAFIDAISTNHVVVGASNTANSALNAINGLEIGGRNLFLLSKNLGEFKLSNSTYVECTRTQNTAVTIKVKTATSSNQGLIFDIPCGNLEPNTDYTFSVYVNDYDNLYRYPHFSIGASDTNVWTGITGKYIQIDKGYNSVTFNTGEHTGYFRFFIGIYLNNIDSYLTVSNAKLEKGNKATDWTPAPEDAKTEGRNLIRYDNVIQFGGGSMDKSKLISAGEITRYDNVTNGGFRFDSKDCYEPSTNYVLSGYITILSGTVVNFRIVSGGKIGSFISFEVDGVSYGNPLVAGFTEINDVLKDGNEHYFELKYKSAATISEDTGYQYTYFQPNSGVATAVEYKLLKFCLRKGNKAIDWSPAPEDISVENIYTTGTTTIDGGKITTHSIKADSIDVDNLFSQNITATNLSITGGKIDVKSNRDINIYTDLTIDLNGITSGIMFGNADINTKVDTNGFTLIAIDPNDNNDFFSWTLNENGLNVNNGTQTYNVFTIYNSGKLYIPKLMASTCAIEYGLLAKSIETKSISTDIAYASTYYHVYGSGATAIIKNITNYVTYQDYNIDVVAGYIYPDITWECPAGYEIVQAIPTIVDNTTASWDRFITFTTQSVGNTGCRLVCYSSGAASITVRMNLTFRATT